MFKRGGMCSTHGIIGTKFMVTRKVWTKLKNGMFGYKNSKVVKYKCKHVSEKRMVTNTIDLNIETDEEGKPALRVGNDFPGVNDWLSGEGETRVGATKGKSGED